MRMPGRWPDRLLRDSPPRRYVTSRTTPGGNPQWYESSSVGSGPMPLGPPVKSGRRPRHGPDTTPALASHRVHRRGSTLTTTFRELGILPETAEALEAVGIVNPFPIQEMTL